jgi:hypothetical protein
VRFVFDELEDIFPASMELKSVYLVKKTLSPIPIHLYSFQIPLFKNILILSYPRSIKWFVSLWFKSKIVCVLIESFTHATFLPITASFVELPLEYSATESKCNQGD